MKKMALLFVLCFARISAQDTQSKPQEYVSASDRDKNEAAPVYFKLDISTPLRDNPYRDEVDPVTGERGYWFLPDGISMRAGSGYNLNDFFTIGAAAGLDWKASHAIVAVPVFAEARLSPRVGEEMRFYATFGYGHGFALGRGNLGGSFSKFSVGIGDDKGSFFFVELSRYNFTLHEMPVWGSISLGLSLQL